MKYRFRTEVFVEADSQEEAEEIFLHVSCYDWDMEEVEESEDSPFWFLVSSKDFFDNLIRISKERETLEESFLNLDAL